MKRITIVLVTLMVLVGCSTRQQSIAENNEVVIIVDGLAYSDRFYFEYGKEEGAYSMRMDQTPFTYLSIDPEEDITDIRESGDTITLTLDGEWVFVKYNFNTYAQATLLPIKGIPC